MPIKYIPPEQALQQMPEVPLLDVRTPAEYKEAHIPGALNLPLFTDAERVEIGTLYKQASPDEAFLRGLEIVGPRMRPLVEEARLMAPGLRVQLHCWRGGQRSRSVGLLLETSGFQVELIKGGYKAYRAWVQQALSNIQARMVILGGPTGAGKTTILEALQSAGEQVIDLEGLARHKGSAFGGLGQEEQPTVRQFENELWQALQALDPNRRIWLENESRAIGRVYIPEGFWAVMLAAPLIDLEVPREERLDRLVAGYARFSKTALRAAFLRIQKRLGGQHLKAALIALEGCDYREAARIALAYYDKAYRYYTFEKNERKRVLPFASANSSPAKTASALIALANENNL